MHELQSKQQKSLDATEYQAVAYTRQRGNADQRYVAYAWQERIGHKAQTQRWFDMKQVIVGKYRFGFEWGTLILREGKAANSEFVPKEGGPVKFLIGADEAQWRDIVESLIHEVQEVIITKMECAWAPSFYIGNDSARYRMTLDHTQFQEMECRTAEFITPALPVLAKAWDKWKSDEKKKAKPKKARKR